MTDEQMSSSKRTVLIAGCSDGGLGAVLAIAFHEAGLHVYATARDPSKMTQIASLGIETLTLDVQFDSSIAACVSRLSSLDILVNNASAVYSMPVFDLCIPAAKKTIRSECVVIPHSHTGFLALAAEVQRNDRRPNLCCFQHRSALSVCIQRLKGIDGHVL